MQLQSGGLSPRPSVPQRHATGLIFGAHECHACTWLAPGLAVVPYDIVAAKMAESNMETMATHVICSELRLFAPLRPAQRVELLIVHVLPVLLVNTECSAAVVVWPAVAARQCANVSASQCLVRLARHSTTQRQRSLLDGCGT